MGQFRRCDSCGAVMQTDSASCPICASPYGSVTAAAPAAPAAPQQTTPPPTPSPQPADGPAVAVGSPGAGTPGVVAGSPAAALPVAPGSSTPPPPPPPPPAARPDPYTQIANPLHTGWGTTPVAAPEPPPTQLTVRRRRSPWLRRGILLLVVALLGVGLWSQRDKIEDAVDDLTAGTENSLVSPS